MTDNGKSARYYWRKKLRDIGVDAGFELSLDELKTLYKKHDVKNQVKKSLEKESVGDDLFSGSDPFNDPVTDREWKVYTEGVDMFFEVEDELERVEDQKRMEKAGSLLHDMGGELVWVVPPPPLLIGIWRLNLHQLTGELNDSLFSLFIH